MTTMEIQVLQLVVPSVLTIIGWLIAASWALEQVRLAHEKNAQLQRELLNESHRRNIAGELVEIYKSMTQAGNNLCQAIYIFWLNHSLEKAGSIDGIKIQATSLVAPINDAFNKTAQEVARLDMWLKVAGEQVPDASLLREAIVDFHQVFILASPKEDNKDCPWAGYQGLLAAYQSNLTLPEQKLEQRSKQITEAITGLIAKLADGTAQINRELCGV